MGVRKYIAAIAAVALTLSGGAAHAACQLGKFADLPVTMSGVQPLVSAKIDGHEVRFLVDSGAFFNTLSPQAVAMLKLNLDAAPQGLTVEGIGGGSSVQLVTVKRFEFAGVPLPRVPFLVLPGAGDTDVVGLIGQTLLDMDDAEYDLANGAIRLMRTTGCDRANLAYWAGEKPFSMLDLHHEEGRRATIADAYVNGVRIRVEFDTGSSTSILSLRAAKRAGISLDAPGVKEEGYSTGIGERPVRNWIVPVASFKIGDEEIRTSHMRIGDFDLDDADMLLGADFFLSHRIYISNGLHRLFFTYNGGPVFNLTAPLKMVDASGAPAKVAEGSALGKVPEPTDAEGFARRGLAFDARHDYAHGLADLDKAITLAPAVPRYRIQRAQAHLGEGKPEPALADLDEALKLAPDEVEALVMRAWLLSNAGEAGKARADADTAARLAPPQADVHAELGHLYHALGDRATAIGQFDLWIAAHQEQGDMAGVLNARCWSRAQLGQDLDKALADCNRALRLMRSPADVLDSRGLVYLRMGRLDQAIADYDAALAKNPKLAWSLYGRGLVRLKKGMKAEGEADLKAALAISPKLADEAKKVGLTLEG